MSLKITGLFKTFTNVTAKFSSAVAELLTTESGVTLTTEAGVEISLDI